MEASSTTRCVRLPNRVPSGESAVNLKEPLTLAQVFEQRSQQFRSAQFLIGADIRGDVLLTYGECRNMALRTCVQLRTRYASTDQKPVAILADNSLEYVVLIIASWYAGLPVLLVPITLPAEVSQILIRAAGATRLIFSSSCAEIAASLQKLCSELIVSIDDITNLVSRTISDPLPAAEEASIVSQLPTDGGKVCVVLSTSGSTTGISVKAVPLTHANVLASCRSRDAHWLPERVTEADCVLGWLPLAHVMGFLLDLTNTAILHGGRYLLFHLQGRPLPVALLQTIGTHKPSFVSAVPWLLDAWRTLGTEKPEAIAPLHTLRALQVGGAPLDDEVADFYLSRQIRLIQSAGMTETSASLFTGVLLSRSAPCDFATLKQAYPLRPHATLEYELILSGQETDEEVGSEHTDPDVLRGELQIIDRGSLTSGYLAAAEANARSFVNRNVERKFRTGDILLVRKAADGGTQVAYAGRVDDTVTLATGEKLDAASFEADLRTALRSRLPAGASLPVMCVLGNQQPLPFLAVVLHGSAIDEGKMWEAVSAVNVHRPASCRVQRDALLVVDADVLPLGRKRQVIRTLAHSKLLARMREVATKILSPSSIAPPSTSVPAVTSIASVGVIMTELADVLGVAAASIAGQEHTTFASLGLTSLLAERLAARLRCAPHLLFVHPSPARLFAALSSQSDSTLPATLASPHTATTEPVAVIGLACRVPGGVSHISDFWRALLAGTDLIASPLDERWQELGHALDAPTKGGLLRADEWMKFDRKFFGIGDAEAGYMDPRQRIALELVWEALEAAGILPSAVASTNTAVFAAFSSDHAGFEEWLHRRVPTSDDVSAYQSVGGAGAAVAGRVAYSLGFRGPTFVVDAACASSAVALHNARTHLMSAPAGSIAIVLASQLMMTPTAHVSLTRAGALSPTAHSAPFDRSANGYVRSDGCAAVVLSRSSTAKSAGWRVWCELLGAALTHGGDTAASLTAPSAIAQESAIRAALTQAGVRTEQVSYVESHGTGTRLGDPIEADVLAQVYSRQHSTSTPPVLVGALKGAIGHTEAASGLLSLVKLSLCSYFSAIPRNVHFSSLTPLVSAASAAQLAFPTEESTPWSAAQDGTRYAAVSNFGFTGTHGHLVFSCPPAAVAAVRSTPNFGFPLVMPIAARSEQSVREQAQRWVTYLSGLRSWQERANACYTAALHREHFDAPPPHGVSVSWRAGIVLGDAQSVSFDAGDALTKPLLSTVAPLSLEPAMLASRPRIAFALAGQGLAMPKGGLRQLCAKLSALSSPFAVMLQRCECAYEQYVASERNCCIPTELLPREEQDTTEAENKQKNPSQAALVSFELAVAALWKSWGVNASIVIGHSLGEIAAAALAGALSVEEAVRLAATRDVAFLRAINAEGTMAAILADRATAERLVGEVNAHFAAEGKSTAGAFHIALTGYNGPTHHVAAGTHAAIAFLLAMQQPVKRVALPVSRPFHSPLMATAAHEWAASHRFDEAAGAPASNSPSVISTATGAAVESSALRRMQHWELHARSPVLFEAALLAAAAQTQIVLAISPAASFASMARRALAPSARCVDSFDSASGDNIVSPAAALFAAAVRLFSLGVRVHWSAIFSDLARGAGLPADARFSVDPWLPTYTWHREPVTLPGRAPAAPTSVARVAKPSVSGSRWIPSPNVLTSLADHVVNYEPILPAAAQLLALLQNARSITSLQLLAPAALTADGGPVETQKEAALVLETTRGDVKISWQAPGVASSAECAAASGLSDRVPDAAESVAATTLKEAERKCSVDVDVNRFYSHLRSAQQLSYGSTYRAVASLRLSPDGSLVISHVAARGKESPDFAFSIAQLDACFHTGAALLPIDAAPHLPLQLSNVSLLAPAADTAAAELLICVHQRLPDTEKNTKSTRLCVFDAATRRSLLLIDRYTVAEVSTTADRRLLHRIVWKPHVIAPTVALPASIVLLSDKGELCARYLRHAHRSNIACIELTAGVSDVKFTLSPLLRASPGGTQRIKLVYCWSLALPAENTGVSSLTQATQQLLQAIQVAAEVSGVVIEMFVLTRGAVAHPGEQTADSQLLSNCIAAALQALVGVAAKELTSDSFRVCAVDLSTAPLSEQTEESLFTLFHSAIEPARSTLALDASGKYFAPSIERSAPQTIPHAAQAPVADRVGLITGGLGGVGRHLASWLLSYAPPAFRVRRLVLVGRTLPADDAAVRLLAENLAAISRATIVNTSPNVIVLALPAPLTSLAAPAPPPIAVTIELRSCDVSNEAQLSALLKATSPNVVVHAAGVLTDRAIAWMSASDMETSLLPKACAAWHLNRLLSPSTQLVLCSSVSAVLHTPGQANYAAGNAFLDALASRRSSSSLTLSIGWGPWRGVGMAATFDAHAARSIARPMLAHNAISALSLCVADALGGVPGSQPHVLLADFQAEEEAAENNSKSSTAVDIEEELIRALSSVIGRSEAELRQYDRDAPLHLLGLDSLAAMELRAILTRRSLPLPLRALRAPTLVSLLTELRAIPTPSSASATPSAHLAALSVVPAPRPVAAPVISRSSWLMPAVGNPIEAKRRIVIFNDAGGDPANFRSWASNWHSKDTAVLGCHWPGHTTRGPEGCCKDLVEASARFIAEALPYLQDRPYAFVGQCVGAYYAYRFAVAIAAKSGARPPSALLAIACPGPAQMKVLTQFTDDPPGALPTDTPDERLICGLHALTLAIGFTEEDWQRLQSDPRLFTALIGDVKMTDLLAEDPPLPCPVFALLGAVDPVVKRQHVGSWLDCCTEFVHRSLPNLGHNIQYEPAVIDVVQEWLEPALSKQ